ncbi:MAG: DUF58 domain-containing protein [Haloarculaceae archaeon]
MRSLGRFHGGLVAALLSAAVGLYVGEAAFFLLATVPLAFVVYGELTGLGPPSLSIERAISEDHTDPGDSVTVTITVTNDGDRPIPDLRLVDDVPEDLAIVAGAPAAGVALRPGETATVEYEVLPPRGTHEFGDVVVRGRSLAGTVVGTTQIEPSGATSLTCDTLLDEYPLSRRATPFAGTQPTDAGGQGTEFYAVREYRRGDARSRIDWRRLARTGELATVTYREERAAAVVFVVDARSAATVRPPGGGPTTTDLSVYAAARGFVTLTEAGHRVGVATLSPDDDEWVPPGRGAAADAAATSLFAALQDDGAGAATPGGAPARVAADGAGTASADEEHGRELALALIERVPAHAQVVLCTPLLDGVPVAVAETLRSNRRTVTVLSPDPTGLATGGERTPGQAVADLARRTRLTALQRAGVPATDWAPAAPLQVALAETLDAHGGAWRR